MPGIFVAGVIAGGITNKVFINDGRLHGPKIAKSYCETDEWELELGLRDVDEEEPLKDEKSSAVVLLFHTTSMPSLEMEAMKDVPGFQARR